jgi:hypothetical protein
MGGPSAPAFVGSGLSGIVDLPERIAALGDSARQRAERLLEVTRVTARTDPPVALEAWLAATFGSADAVREQTVVRVTNRATLEGTIFAPLRAHRPIEGPVGQDLRAEIDATLGDAFCAPESGTPADTFGRVRGAHIVTGANAAAADAHHAVLVFDRHDPLDIDASLVADLFATGRRWADAARTIDQLATCYLLIWNCGWRAGGSIVHGHGQALLGPPPHHARLLRFARDAERHRGETGRELVDDLVAVHRDLGLVIERPDGVVILASVTPVKERELLVVGRPGGDERAPAFTAGVSHALQALRDRLGVRAFNLALWRPPLDEPAEWAWLPPIARIVDRGDPARRPSDIGAMELYATPVVASDPYEVADAVRGR